MKKSTFIKSMTLKDNKYTAKIIKLSDGQVNILTNGPIILSRDEKKNLIDFLQEEE